MDRIRFYTPADRAGWDRFIDTSKNGTFLFRRDYMEYHAERFQDASALAVDQGGDVVAVFPANRTEDRIASHGGLSYGGMVTDARMTTSRALDLFVAWLGFLKSQGAREVLYKAVPSIYHRLPAEEDRYALFLNGAELYRREVLAVIDLTRRGGVQERRRRGAKKAAKHGLAVRETRDLGAFWPVLERNLLERHGVRPVHAVEEMTLLQSRFPENIRLFCVVQGARVCAGSLLYCTPNAIHAQYIAADADAREQGALDLLFLHLLEEEWGSARYFDFGNSNENDGRYLNRGLSDFKEGFGARAVCHDFYRLRLSDA